MNLSHFNRILLFLRACLLVRMLVEIDGFHLPSANTVLDCFFFSFLSFLFFFFLVYRVTCIRQVSCVFPEGCLGGVV
jgi:hypothetical protein